MNPAHSEAENAPWYLSQAQPSRARNGAATGVAPTIAQIVARFWATTGGCPYSETCIGQCRHRARSCRIEQMSAAESGDTSAIVVNLKRQERKLPLWLDTVLRSRKRHAGMTSHGMDLRPFDCGTIRSFDSATVRSFDCLTVRLSSAQDARIGRLGTSGRKPYESTGRYRGRVGQAPCRVGQAPRPTHKSRGMQSCSADRLWNAKVHAQVVIS